VVEAAFGIPFSVEAVFLYLLNAVHSYNEILNFVSFPVVEVGFFVEPEKKN
jgi:hypothetical protein